MGVAFFWWSSTRRLSGLNIAGDVWAELTPEWYCLGGGAPSYLSSCKLLAKSDNPQHVHLRPTRKKKSLKSRKSRGVSQRGCEGSVMLDILSD